MASQNPVYCRNVAKALGIQGHKCQRKYFLDKKNCARHKLRAYDINDPSDREKVAQLLSFDRQISRSSRIVPLIRDRIYKVIGGEHLELCDNLRTKLMGLSNLLHREEEQDENENIATTSGSRTTVHNVTVVDESTLRTDTNTNDGTIIDDDGTLATINNEHDNDIEDTSTSGSVQNTTFTSMTDFVQPVDGK